MHVLIADRQQGKSTRLMEWVQNGVPCNDYPFWTRVAIVSDLQRCQDLKDRYWRKMKDFDHRVYTMREIENGRFTSRETLYRLDDLDSFLPFIFPGLKLDGFTITATPWVNELIIPRMGDQIHE